LPAVGGKMILKLMLIIFGEKMMKFGEEDAVEKLVLMIEWFGGPIEVRSVETEDSFDTEFWLVTPIEPTKRTVVVAERAKGFHILKYFMRKYLEYNKLTYPVSNWVREESFLKLKISDWFYKNGFEDEDIRKFIDWTFQREDVPIVHYLPYRLGDYIREVLSKDPRPKRKEKDLGEPKTQKDEQLARLAEIEALEYYGRGYCDELLTKEQFFVGMKWRITNMKKEDLKSLKEWQKKKFSDKKYEGVAERLEGWKSEYYDQAFGYNLMKNFYQVEAQRLGISEEEVKKKYAVK
jgi:hypothetical protein